MSASPILVLASASPRRRALLEAAGLTFEVRPADLEEHVEPAWSPEEAARELALQKARAVAARTGEPAIVLGSDTVVAVAVTGPDGGELQRILGKPRDEEEAGEFLGLLSGTRHRVVTGIALVRTRDGSEHVDHELTWVTMRSLGADEIEAYVESGEWRDKAGGYAIQENADVFVTELAGGGFDNVVGLPVARVLEAIRNLGP